MKRLIPVFIFLGFLLPLVSRAAILLDATSTDGHDTQRNAGTYSWSQTVNGSNDLLLVQVSNHLPTSDQVTGVTYNGAAMTRLAALQDAASDNYAYLYGLVGPSTGTHSVAVTVGTTAYYDFSAVAYSGVDQTNGAGTFATGTATISGTTVAATVTSVPANAWLIGYFRSDGGTPITAGTSTTARVNTFGLAQGSAVSWTFDSGGPLTAGSHYLAANAGGSAALGIIAVAVPTASSAAAKPARRKAKLIN